MTDEELIEWLRLHGSPRDMAAADRIEALLRERDAAWNAAMDAAAAVIVTEVKRIDAIVATLPVGPPSKRSIPLYYVSENTSLLEDEILALKTSSAVLAEIGGEA
jgi:hypothetical protein